MLEPASAATRLLAGFRRCRAMLWLRAEVVERVCAAVVLQKAFRDYQGRQSSLQYLPPGGVLLSADPVVYTVEDALSHSERAALVAAAMCRTPAASGVSKSSRDADRMSSGFDQCLIVKRQCLTVKRRWLMERIRF